MRASAPNATANIPAGNADMVEGVQKYKLPAPPITLMIGSGNNSYVGFKQVDFTNMM